MEGGKACLSGALTADGGGLRILRVARASFVRLRRCPRSRCAWLRGAVWCLMAVVYLCLPVVYLCLLVIFFRLPVEYSPVVALYFPLVVVSCL